LTGPLGLARAARLIPTRDDWRVFWRFALPRAASAAIDASSVWVGVLMTAILAGQVQAGVFAAVGRYALAGQLVMHGLRIAVAPQLSRLLGAGRTGDAAAVHRHATMWIVVLSWPAYVFLAIFGGTFLGLFGSGFTNGATALAVICVAMLINVGMGNVQTLLLMSGNSGQHLVATATGLAVTVLAGLALIPRHGVLGAAISWAAGIIVENAIAAVAARRAVGQSLLAVPLLRMAGIVLGATAVVGVLAVALAGRGVAGLGLALAMTAALCGASLCSGRVRAGRRTLLASLRGNSA
jgi:O-antigen/teichoic acid export membrane protein